MMRMRGGPCTAFVSCLPGLEPILKAELSAIGLNGPMEWQSGGVIARARPEQIDAIRCRSGVASHVLVRLDSVPIRALGELERKVRESSWGRALASRHPIKVVAFSSKRSRVWHEGAIRERVRRALGIEEASMEEAGATATLHVRFDGDVCTFSLNDEIDPLYRRGYRLETAKAPLREDIAAALLHAARWDVRREALVDPMCGSGTIVIEAAAFAAGLDPGRLRFGQSSPSSSAPRTAVGAVFGSDRDTGAVKIARANATRAGVEDMISWSQCAFSSHPMFAPDLKTPLLVICNPPYGQRLEASRALYQRLGQIVKFQPELRRLVFVTSNRTLAESVGLPLERLFVCSHGGHTIGAYTTSTKMIH